MCFLIHLSELIFFLMVYSGLFFYHVFEVDAEPGFVLNCTFQMTPDGLMSEIRVNSLLFYLNLDFTVICVLKAL